MVHHFQKNEAPTQQQSYQAPAQQMPKPDSVPVIDIQDEDIPFAPIGLQYPMSVFVM